MTSLHSTTLLTLCVPGPYEPVNLAEVGPLSGTLKWHCVRKAGWWPLARHQHHAVVLPPGTFAPDSAASLLVYGGYDEAQALCIPVIMSPIPSSTTGSSQCCWRPLKTSGDDPLGRFASFLSYHQGSLLVHGGMDMEGTSTDEGSVLELQSGVWSFLEVNSVVEESIPAVLRLWPGSWRIRSHGVPPG